jgi:hypothetical protein
MHISKLIFSVDQLIRSIGLSIEKRLSLPSLILIYSGIDLASWLGADNDQMSAKESFTSWVQKYMLPIEGSDCSANELYLARCEILHTLTPSSELSDLGESRCIRYAWSSNEEIKAIGKKILSRGVLLFGEDLFEAFRIGWQDFIEAQRSMKTRSPLFEERALKVYVPVSKSKQSKRDSHPKNLESFLS